MSRQMAKLIADEKIIEINNHRHDISLNFTEVYIFKGLGIGLIIGPIPVINYFRFGRKYSCFKL
jgi:uncharacterized membrane protein YukC